MGTRFSKFGLTILPKYESREIDWKSLSKLEVSETLVDLDFIKPLEISGLMKSMKLKARCKGLKNGKKQQYFSMVKNFGGQLELGDGNGVPHYQLWLEVKPASSKKLLLEYFSEKIYGVRRSDQVSVFVLGGDMKDFKDYCGKENRGNLAGVYGDKVDKKMWDFLGYQESEPESKLILETPYTYQKFVTALLKEDRVPRKIYWFVDMVGNTGKSLFCDVLLRSPWTKSVLVGLDHHRAFKMNLADGIADFIEDHGEEPEAILLDIPRAEESRFLHEIYAALEEVQNGRVVARFGNRSRCFSIRRNIRVLVFSNCPPDVSEMSRDRWKIFGLFRSLDEKDVLIQEVETRPKIVLSSKMFVTWQHEIETIPLSSLVVEKKSDEILKMSFLINFLTMKMIKEKTGDLMMKPGVLKKLGFERTATATQAPESIKAMLLKTTNPFKNLD